MGKLSAGNGLAYLRRVLSLGSLFFAFTCFAEEDFDDPRGASFGSCKKRIIPSKNCSGGSCCTWLQASKADPGKYVANSKCNEKCLESSAEGFVGTGIRSRGYCQADGAILVTRYTCNCFYACSTEFVASVGEKSPSKNQVKSEFGFETAKEIKPAPIQGSGSEGFQAPQSQERDSVSAGEAG